MVREEKSSANTKQVRKAGYFVKINQLFEEYPKLFIVGVDNVGSRQMQEIRIALRKKAVLLNGKNTMMRKAIKGMLEKSEDFEKLIPHIHGNIGFVFTEGDLSEIRDQLLENKVAAPAKAGSLAPIDVKIPPQNTGLPPDKTSFFQALQIPTKIAKGTIEIMTEVHLIKKGDKVGASEAALLNMLGYSPFSYGLVVRQVYDSGTCFGPEVLDITSAALREKIQQTVTRLACLSLAIGIPTAASIPHLLANGISNLIGLCAATDTLSFKQAAPLLELLRDPSKLAALKAAPAAGKGAAPAAAAAAAGKAAAAAPAAKVEEEKEEAEEEDMGFGLFD